LDKYSFHLYPFSKYHAKERERHGYAKRERNKVLLKTFWSMMKKKKENKARKR